MANKKQYMKIKILVDAHVFDESFQGTTTYIKGIYNELIHCEMFEIYLCAYNIENLKKTFLCNKFNFIQLKSKNKISRLAYEIPSIIKKYNINFAHFQYITPYIKTCYFINTIHDLLFLEEKEYFPWQYRLKNKFLFKISANMADIILTVSKYSQNQINNKFKIELDKIYITPNAVNIPTLDNETDVKKKYRLRDYIHYVSRFEPRKNQIGLLRIYLDKKLYEKYDLVLIGRKAGRIEKDYYSSFIKEIPTDISSHIHIYEDISDSELETFHQQSSCCVYPSYAEGFGIPPLEAGINKCKVLCSNSTAMADFDFFPYMFNPHDFNDFGSQLISLLNDTTYPYEDIQNKIMTKYNWHTIANNLKKIIIDKFNENSIHLDPRNS